MSSLPFTPFTLHRLHGATMGPATNFRTRLPRTNVLHPQLTADKGSTLGGITAAIAALIFSWVGLTHHAEAQEHGSTASTTSQTATKAPPPVTKSASSPRKYRIERDIVFSEVDGEELLCDIYLPSEAPVAPRPAVIVVHGGAWVSGDKWATGIYAQSIAEHGMVAVSVNYRLAPKYKFPAQVDDVRSALVWLVEHADKYHVDRDRIAIMGYSAGAHLSCLIGVLQDAPWETIAGTTAWPKTDPRWQSMPQIQCVVAGGAPCDFTEIPPDNQGLAFFLGGSRREKPETYSAASPVSHASDGDPPILMFHGTADNVVAIESSRKLYQRHQSLNVASRFVALDGLGHLLTFLHEKSRDASIEFLTRWLNVATEGAE